VVIDPGNLCNHYLKTSTVNLTETNWQQQIEFPILGLLQLLPLLAMVLILLLRNQRLQVVVGFGFALAELILAIKLYLNFDLSKTGFQFAEQFTLFSNFNYHAAVDGISVIFILLTAFLCALTIIYGHLRNFAPREKYFATLFAVESSLIAMFVTLNLLWFVFLAFIQIIPIAYLLWTWSTSPEKDRALKRFLQFMATSILLLALGTLMLGWQHIETVKQLWSFDLFDLVHIKSSGSFDSIIFFLLFYGLAIRVPLFPLHGWLPRIAEHGSIAVAPVLLLGLKVGIYGMVRFIFPIMPETVMHWHVYVVAFAVAGVFYAALLAMLQDNLRRLLAYAVVSHTSILVIGVFSLSPLAIQGSIFLSINFGLAIAGLLFMTGLVFARTNTTLLPQLGGLFDRIPVISATFFVAGLAIVGMPGTPGFDAAHLVLEAAMHHFGAVVTIAAAVGNVIAAGFLLWAFQRAFLSAPQHSRKKEIHPSSGLENVLAAAILLLLVIAGFYSEPWLELIETTAQSIGKPFGRS